MKTVNLLRWGAWGDMVMVTPLLRALKDDGYHVTVNVTRRGRDIIKFDPHIDKIVEYKENSVPDDKIPEYWANLAKGFDKFINLSGSIEEGLLAREGTEDYNLRHTERHKRFNFNYYDRTLEIGGYGHIKGQRGELHFSKAEEDEAKAFRHRMKDKFMILWALAGSSYHKAYPYAELVAKAFLDKHKDAMIMTVGDSLCEILEWQHPQTYKYSGKWGIRKSLVMTKYADMVIGPETGVLAGAGCFDTPKVIMLSHSSKENLSKYWVNCTALSAPVDCQPCHQLHYTLDSCPLVDGIKSPVCMAEIKPAALLYLMEIVYDKWREDNGMVHGERGQNLFSGRRRYGLERQQSHPV